MTDTPEFVHPSERLVRRSFPGVRMELNHFVTRLSVAAASGLDVVALVDDIIAEAPARHERNAVDDSLRRLARSADSVYGKAQKQPDQRA